MLKFHIVTAFSFLVVVACIAALVALILFFFRRYEGLAQRALLRKYDGMTLHAAREPGDVVLVFHTYHGVLAWFTQTPHVVALSPEDARVLLGRLVRFNLTWGLLACGGLFVPPLSLINYIGQRRAITAQQLENEMSATLDPSQTPNQLAASISENPYAATESLSPGAYLVRRTSLFHQLIGWTAAMLCAVFGVSTFTLALRGEFGPAAGGLLFTLFLGWLARDFIKNSTYERY
jgi:hypothetical protein